MQVEKALICCLKATTAKLKKSRLIPLEGTDEVVIGRSPDLQVCLNSPMISRKHAILSKEGTTWSITDNKSLNGVFINSKKLAPSEACPLKDGDIVQLGVPIQEGKPPEFVWKYLTQCKVKKYLGTSKDKMDIQPASLKDSQDSVDLAPTQSRKRGVRSPVNMSDDERDPPSKKQCVTPALWSPSLDMKKKLQEQEQLAQKKMAEQEAKLAELQAQLQQKERMQEQMMEELQRKEEQMTQQLAKQQEELADQKKKLEEEVKRNYEKEIQEKEQALLNRLSQEKNRLQEEKRRVEESLQQEMERKLEEKDKDLEAKLVAEKERLDRIIEQRDMEHLLLQNELDDSKCLAQQEQENILKAKEDILTNFAQLMETELQCSICNELFVQATSLNCSHSFCALCITRWMEVKKECPVCRTKITSHIRSLVLDSYIDKMAENLNEDMKKRRQDMVQERKDEMKKREEKKVAKASTSRGGRRGRRGRRGGRGASSSRGRATGEVISSAIVVESGSSSDLGVGHGVDHEEEVVTYLQSDSSSDSSSSDSDEESHFHYHSDSSDSSMEGAPGTYYGGYGVCYRCGRRGHWANGCPFYL